MRRLRTGDEVVVLSGADKGSRGEIKKLVFDAARQVTHVLVAGVNLRWFHSRGNPHHNDPGGRLRKEVPLAACKVALYSADRGGPERVRIKVTETTNEYGRTVRRRERVFVSGKAV